MGGYSETLGFGLSDNCHWGGILKLSDLDSDNFHFGGYSDTLRFGLSDDFHISLTIFIPGGGYFETWIWNLCQFSLGGYSETLRFGLSDNFHFGVGYSETLGFGISDNFHWGGYSETLGFGLSDNFHFSLTILFWGSILKLSDSESLTIFIGGVF